jgi:hypothetical protein
MEGASGGGGGDGEGGGRGGGQGHRRGCHWSVRGEQRGNRALCHCHGWMTG